MATVNPLFKPPEDDNLTSLSPLTLFVADDAISNLHIVCTYTPYVVEGVLVLNAQSIYTEFENHQQALHIFIYLFIFNFI